MGLPAGGVGSWFDAKEDRTRSPKSGRTATDSLCRLPPGLLTNDTLILALMRHHAVTALAGHDADFDRVAAITRFRPACALEAPRRAPGFSASGC